MTTTAKLFTTGRSQAVRLPKEFRFKGAEVFIRRDLLTGEVVLSPKPATWAEFFELADISAYGFLIKVNPVGPACHEGYDTCFQEVNQAGDFILQLESLIADRKVNPQKGSYTTSLFESGIQKIAQKVGEEAVETILEAQATNDQAMIYEASDLVYHLLVLLQAKGLSWSDVVNQLIAKHKK